MAAHGTTDHRVRVIYVAGDGRSGTTLLSRILGSYDGCMAAGELYDIWAESLDGDRICSCGVQLRDCTFWNAVKREALGAYDRPSIESCIALRSSVQSIRHLPFLLFPRLRTPSYRRRLSEYVDLLERLYLAIQVVSGCDVIVDSSKLAAYALALAESPLIDTRIVHVLRDSRACVYSWNRLKPESAAGGQARFLPQRSLVRTAMVWNMRNTVLAWATRRFSNSTTVRYEDFVRQPRAVMSNLVEELGVTSHPAHWVHDDEVVLKRESHIFAGNPSRVERGSVRIRADEEWRTHMSRFKQGVVFALTMPVLWKFGYSHLHQARPLTSRSEVTAPRQP